MNCLQGGTSRNEILVIRYADGTPFKLLARSVWA